MQLRRRYAGSCTEWCRGPPWHNTRPSFRSARKGSARRASAIVHHFSCQWFRYQSHCWATTQPVTLPWSREASEHPESTSNPAHLRAMYTMQVELCTNSIPLPATCAVAVGYFVTHFPSLLSCKLGCKHVAAKLAQSDASYRNAVRPPGWTCEPYHASRREDCEHGKRWCYFRQFSKENAGCKSKKNGRLEVVVVGLK